MASYQNPNASNIRLLDVGNALRTIELCLQEKVRIQINTSMPEDIKAEKLEAIDEILKSNTILWQ
jgi:hypothetical protein